MKTNVQATSIEAYKRIYKLNRRELAVLGVILQCAPVCNQEIADRLDWPVNCVTGRTFELREKGLVEEAGKAVYKNGRNVIHWQTVPKVSIKLERFRNMLFPARA